MAKKRTAKKATAKKKATKRVSRKNSHVVLDKGYILPHGYEVKYTVFKKKAAKKTKRK